jgi:EAL domain-containing protein (putative c-di-GMP-specific phosphodiesterase class I)
MKLLRQLGIKICMDDFGTGYSSLEYLKVLPLDQIKIDGSFVKHMHTDPKDFAIVKSMISLGEAFGFEVVAEGVEKKEDLELLKSLECDRYQGYFFSKPVTVDEFNKL